MQIDNQIQRTGNWVHNRQQYRTTQKTKSVQWKSGKDTSSVKSQFATIIISGKGGAREGGVCAEGEGGGAKRAKQAKDIKTDFYQFASLSARVCFISCANWLTDLFVFCVNIRRTVNVDGHIKAKLSHQTTDKRHIRCSNQTPITIKNDSDIKLNEPRRRKIERQKSLGLARVYILTCCWLRTRGVLIALSSQRTGPWSLRARCTPYRGNGEVANGSSSPVTCQTRKHWEVWQKGRYNHQREVSSVRSTHRRWSLVFTRMPRFWNRTRPRAPLGWSLCTLYLHACQLRVTVGDSNLCCCTWVSYFER